ncbi:MAG: zinc ribbon domain-containing protein [Chitinivibrionales bacterium]|nr:zinc ribbon domain-containing protein [Chitinivibrionales bacterium]MBD3356396.1 zinc ribbon domain-containing protein [Chitinivibrionales bacterium]
MPTYEYECEKCGHLFEEFQSMTAQPLTQCPAEGCDGKVHRILSGGAGFLFKGDGFYITDYRSDSYKKAEKAEKETTGKSNTKSSDSSGSGDSSKGSSSSSSNSSSSSSNTGGSSSSPS